MKNYKLPFFAFGFLLILSACNKTGEQSATGAATGSATVAQSSSVAQWKSVGGWSTAAQSSYTSYLGSLSDSAVTMDVASAGLVLVYAKGSDGTVQSLPYESGSGTQKTSWYYQVAQGSVQIIADAYAGAVAPSSAEKFSYVIITPQQLSNLKAQGQTIDQLIKMPYSQAVDLK